jgi:LPXTG-motif cell wall-anchored protein
MSLRLAIATSTFLAIGGAVSAQQSVRPAATASGCKCQLYPWQPDPPCVKECAGLLFTEISTAELVKTLKLSPAAAHKINELKVGGVTAAETETFLRSPEGVEFTKLTTGVAPNELQRLAATAEDNARTTTSGAAAGAPGTSRTLPRTGSSWPLLGLAGALSLAIGLGLTIMRRFAR